MTFPKGKDSEECSTLQINPPNIKQYILSYRGMSNAHFSLIDFCWILAAAEKASFFEQRSPCLVRAHYPYDNTIHFSCTIHRRGSELLKNI